MCHTCSCTLFAATATLYTPSFEGLGFSSERFLNLDKIFNLHQAIFLVFSIILCSFSSIVSLLLGPKCTLLPGVGLLQGIKGDGVVTLFLDADADDWESSISLTIWFPGCQQLVPVLHHHFYLPPPHQQH